MSDPYRPPTEEPEPKPEESTHPLVRYRVTIVVTLAAFIAVRLAVLEWFGW